MISSLAVPLFSRRCRGSLFGRLRRIALFSSLVLSLFFVTGCASNPQVSDSAPDQGYDSSLDSDNYDRFESFNRVIFSFNKTLDRYLLRPLAVGYTWITPDPIESGIGNFFGNLGEVNNVVNDLLQWKWKQASNDTGRFLLNSTIGLAGFFDIAGKVGLNRSDGEDFGQTLAVWGVPQGPYLVLPFLGPNTITSSLATPVDWVVDPLANPVSFVDDRQIIYGLTALKFVNLRANLLDAEKLISGDEYSFMRNAYRQRREYLIKDGVVEDDFGGDFEGSEDEAFDF